MIFNVTIVTTANKTLKFSQQDTEAIEQILGNLRKPSQLFTNRSMVIATGEEIQLISPASLTRIVIETELDLSDTIPQLQDAHMTLLEEGASTAAPLLTDAEISSRVDCFFEGGDTISFWLSGPRPTNPADRMLRISRLFENPVLIYKLPQGGVGFINPARLISIRLGISSDLPPNNTWRLNKNS
jgi:hypothetical protein